MGDESADQGGRRSERQSGLIADACSRFEAVWQTGQQPRIEDFLPAQSPDKSGATLRNLLVQLVGIDLECRWKTAGVPSQQETVARQPAGIDAQAACPDVSESSLSLPPRPRLADYVARYPLLGPVEQLPCDLILCEYYARRRYGDRPTPAEYLDAFGAIHPDLAKQLQAIDDGMVAADRNAASGQPEKHGPTGTALFDEAPLPKQPERIGRYRVERLLGQGGFGLVYLAHDEQLHRPVAIKVPHSTLILRPQDAQPYLTEACTVANLDHPNIVPVYDVGSTEEFPVYVVCKFIDGTSLAAKIKQTRLWFAETVELVMTVAEALHYAHKRGLVHRDIKPANILLDCSGKPFVADFGLALREEDVGKRASTGGTPAYMSPEQARGEGHRVDGRSDIFSLGIVLYELLAGRRPFRADDIAELMDQITTLEPKPLRQTDDTIPKELERICLRALSKRATERYLTAKDLADDLRHFLAEGLYDISSTVPPAQEALAAETKVAADTPPATPTPETPPIKIVPKGLRSFDAEDADFFLELLPGARDREGLPDSIRFWKNRIEEVDADRTFSVGLIYGPSGCGKSSLVKAGLLPRLSHHLIPVYVEATAGETDNRLLRGLRKHCSELAHNLGLKDTLAALRRGEGIPTGKKVLIILDQFEQWLHVQKGEEATELVYALRQCDGGHVQCIVMVRDDFWMAATRFMRSLEIRLVEGENSNAVDLFPLRHAEKVLAAFGRAFGDLPEGSAKATKEQKNFLTHAVQDLAEDGKVVCVRLALFAEMLKGKPWTPATLKEVGGTAGVGVTFLEETFSASTAPPDHRYHQKAARAVLKALLPDSGTDIKGHMRSYAELLAASGYADRPKDFHDLIGILDGEIRLITPTDPEGKEEADPSIVQAGAKYYQLTHDYLVPSLREWLTRKQRETRRGRAELRLAERSTLWNAKPENRYLPAWWEVLNIRLFTRNKDWTDPQRKMMGKAGRVHGIRSGILATMLVLASIVGVGIRHAVVEKQNATRAEGLVDALVHAPITEVPSIVTNLGRYRTWTDPLFKAKFDQAEEGSTQRLNVALALLPVDASQVDYLSKRLLTAAPDQVAVIVARLADHRAKVVPRFWSVLDDANGDADQRLRAACALVAYTPKDPRWKKVGGDLAAKLVTENSLVLGKWLDALRPVSGFLAAPLADMIQAEGISESRKIAACEAVAGFAAYDPTQFQKLEKRLAMPAATSDDQKISLAKQQANMAAALLRMNQYGRMRELLKHSPDPTVRSYLIHRFSPLAIDPKIIWRPLESEKEVSVRRALLLGLGECDPGQLVPAEREAVISQLVQWYRDDPDPGVHGATEWLLRHWKQDQRLKQIEQEWTKDKKQREQRLQHIGQELTTGKAKPQWYVTSQGQTMVVIPGPLEFLGGSYQKRYASPRGLRLQTKI